MNPQTVALSLAASAPQPKTTMSSAMKKTAHARGTPMPRRRTNCISRRGVFTSHSTYMTAV